MKLRPSLAALALTACVGGPPSSSPSEDNGTLVQQVWDTELAFAATMAARDHEAFASFVSDEALFFSGSKLLRGKAAVVEGWRPLFVDEAPPFSWYPDRVEVLDSGGLAISTGPVIGPDGTLVGRFNSVWRREPEGWKVIFDKGEEPECQPRQ